MARTSNGAWTIQSYSRVFDVFRLIFSRFSVKYHKTHQILPYIVIRTEISLLKYKNSDIGPFRLFQNQKGPGCTRTVSAVQIPCYLNSYPFRIAAAEIVRVQLRRVQSWEKS